MRRFSDALPARTLRADRINPPVPTRSTRSRLALAAAILALPAVRASGAHVTSTWLGPTSGSWTNPALWSAGAPFNNGVNTYDAIIGAAGGTYTVGLNTSIALTSFTLSAPGATLDHTAGTLSAFNPIMLSAGTYMMNGGTLSGGTVNLSGTGRLAFGSSVGNLNDVFVNGDLSLDGNNSRARLMNGSRFTGDATVSGNGSILNFEYDATLQSGQTVTLDNLQASLGVGRNGTTDSTLTIASGASVHGRGRITSSNFTGGTQNTVVNNGTIAADVTGGGIAIDPNIFVNNGAVQVVGGATMSISGGTTFTNNGSVTANAGSLNIASTNWTNGAGKTIAVTDGTLTLGGTWSNAGTISVSNSMLNLGGTFTTAGVNLANFARSGGTVNLTGTMDNAGNTLPLSASTGSWRLSGGTIRGGTITRAGGADLIFTSNAGTISAASIVGDIDLAETSARVRFQDGGDFTGNATLSGIQSLLNYEYDATIGAGRTVNLNGSAAALGVARNSTTGIDSTLTIAPGALVRGRGQITSGNFAAGTDNHVVNNGTVSADNAAQQLTINPNRFTNSGVTRAINGATLTISSSNWTNAAGGTIAGADGSTINFSGNWSSPGSISLASGATLHMGGTFATSGLNLAGFNRTGATTINLTGNLDNNASTLALSAATGAWRLSGGTITGGTITRAGDADLTFTNSGGVLRGTTLIGDATFSQTNARVRLQEGADFTGSATLSASGALLNYEYDATIGPGRTINLENAGATLGIASGGSPSADRTLTIAPGAAVRGRGQIASGINTGGTANAVVNNGSIAADVASSGLVVNPNRFTNNATVRVVNGGTLLISAGSWTNAATGSIALDAGAGTFAGSWNNLGTVSLANGATLNLSGATTATGLGLDKFVCTGATTLNLLGAVENTGGTLTLGPASGIVRLNGGTITGGTIVRSGGGDLTFSSGGGALVGATLVGDANFAETNARLRLQNGGDFTGSATLSASGSLLNYEHDATIGGGRTIHLENSGATLGIAQGGGADRTLTIAPGATVRGRGSVTSGVNTGGTANAIINNGLIRADINAAQLAVNPNIFTNHGTLLSTNGATLSISAASFTNAAAGRLVANEGGRIKTTGIAGNLNDTAVDGPGSSIDLDGASYAINQPISVTNNAMLYLRGGWQKNADLNVGGRVVFDYPEPEPENTSPFAIIKAQVISGYNNGLWNGPGIHSAQAAANPAFGVGYAEASAILPPGAGGGHFGGHSIDNDAVLVAYTRYGDANLDFTVNLTDFNRLAANFGQSGKLWTDGDFDYNGIVNLTDFNRLAANFGLSASGPDVTAGDWAALAAAVPEPGSAGVGGLFALTLAARRRRSRRA